MSSLNRSKMYPTRTGEQTCCFSSEQTSTLTAALINFNVNVADEFFYLHFPCDQLWR